MKCPIGAARFLVAGLSDFYAYYLICVGLFATFWFIYGRTAFSILVDTWHLSLFLSLVLVEVGVAVNWCTVL